MSDFDKARELLRQFKGDTYLYGFGVLDRTGGIAAALGRRAALVRDSFAGAGAFANIIQESLSSAGLEIAGVVDGARPNAPREDLARITASLRDLEPDVSVSFGGGSTIDAVKAADVLCSLGGGIDDYFGVGQVTRALAAAGKALRPHVAIQTAASSAAHLTKYSNITDLSTGQKKLIVDPAIVPPRAVFDYQATLGAPASLTADGGLDGIAHCLEVLYGAVGKPYYATMEQVAREGIRLVMNYLPGVLADPNYAGGREALALATDLGGYAIMIGGTNGAHLTSFSLIDVLSHGRACAIMNPYYTVFFAPAVQEPLRVVAGICRELSYAPAAIENLSGRELGLAVAEALISFQRGLGVPVRLSDVPGFTGGHIERALAAAKDPQLKMKLENMPVPLTAAMVDEYMGPVLEAARTGDLQVIKNVAA
ncbi:MAG: iron-containing alcohol dehydrogenase [Acidobacteriota bacterium]